jgi:hypothetical protein
MFQTPFKPPDGRGSSCPRCGASLSPDDINVSADTARCRSCASVYAFSDLVHEDGLAHFNLSQPPSGVSVDQFANGFRVSATTRAWYALFLVPFMCVWSGMSLGGIYGSQIRSGKLNIFISLFGIPFILATVFLGSQALMATFGRIAVLRDGDDGAIFTGIGPIGWTRRFRWSTVMSAVEADGRSNYGFQGRLPMQVISLKTVSDGIPKTIRFGTQLSADRREFLLALIRSQLRKVR